MLMMEDRGLLGSFREGDQGALYRVYDHYRHGVGKMLRGGFSFRSGGDRYRFAGFRSQFEVEDLLQETFAKAFVPKARTGYTGLSPYGPYINGIARNLVIDEFRRRRREISLFVPEGADVYMEEEVGEEAPIGEWTRGSKGPEQLNIRREQQEMVQKFVASLDDELRTVVNLRFIENLSQDETAERMNVDRNRVRRWIKDIRQRLLRHMKREGHIHSLDTRELLALLASVV